MGNITNDLQTSIPRGRINISAALQWNVKALYCFAQSVTCEIYHVDFNLGQNFVFGICMAWNVSWLETMFFHSLCSTLVANNIQTGWLQSWYFTYCLMVTQEYIFIHSLMVTYLIILQRCTSSLFFMLFRSVAVAGLHSRSATTAARGHVLDMRLVVSTHSPHIQPSPPITKAFCASVPLKFYNTVIVQTVMKL